MSLRKCLFHSFYRQATLLYNSFDQSKYSYLVLAYFHSRIILHKRLHLQKYKDPNHFFSLATILLNIYPQLPFQVCLVLLSNHLPIILRINHHLNIHKLLVQTFAHLSNALRTCPHLHIKWLHSHVFCHESTPLCIFHLCCNDKCLCHAFSHSKMFLHICPYLHKLFILY